MTRSDGTDASEGRFAELAGGPVFVVGSARSGTTWVYEILTAHDEVAGAYESWLFTDFAGLGSLVRAPHHRFAPDDEKPTGLGRFIERERLVAELRGVAARIFEHAIEPQHRFFVEKSPSHWIAMPFIKEVFPNARFVHVLRDGRDVAVSVRAAARSWMARWARGLGRSVDETARVWDTTVRGARRLGAELGKDFYELRYEELKADPKGGIGRLFDFCGLPHDPDVVARIADATDFSKAHGGGEDAFYRGGRVGDWRRQLGLRDRYLFERAAGDLLAELGYSGSRRWWLTRS